MTEIPFWASVTKGEELPCWQTCLIEVLFCATTKYVCSPAAVYAVAATLMQQVCCCIRCGTDLRTIQRAFCRIARWDMRAPEGVVQELSSPSVMSWDGGHDYKTNVAFNCMATSGTLSLACN